MLRRFLRYRRDVRERVEREAANLMLFLGEGAYDEARDRSRSARERDVIQSNFWARVARSIASKTGRTIGEKTADRFDRPPLKRTPAEREIHAGLVDIAAGIADLARGQGDTTSLHNLKARTLQIADLGTRRDEVAHAAAELCRAADELAEAAPENASAFAAGAYPHKAEAAGQALQRFRAAVQNEQRDDPFRV